MSEEIQDVGAICGEIIPNLPISSSFHSLDFFNAMGTCLQAHYSWGMLGSIVMQYSLGMLSMVSNESGNVYSRPFNVIGIAFNFSGKGILALLGTGVCFIKGDAVDLLCSLSMEDDLVEEENDGMTLVAVFEPTFLTDDLS